MGSSDDDSGSDDESGSEDDNCSDDESGSDDDDGGAYDEDVGSSKRPSQLDTGRHDSLPTSVRLLQ